MQPNMSANRRPERSEVPEGSAPSPSPSLRSGPGLALPVNRCTPTTHDVDAPGWHVTMQHLKPAPHHDAAGWCVGIAFNTHEPHEQAYIAGVLARASIAGPQAQDYGPEPWDVRCVEPANSWESVSIDTYRVPSKDAATQLLQDAAAWINNVLDRDGIGAVRITEIAYVVSGAHR